MPDSSQNKAGSADDAALAARLVAGDHALADQLLAELRQSRLLNQVAEAVNGPGGLDAILPRLVSLMATALDADRATLFLHDAEARQLFSRVARASQALYSGPAKLNASMMLMPTRALIARSISPPATKPKPSWPPPF